MKGLSQTLLMIGVICLLFAPVALAQDVKTTGCTQPPITPPCTGSSCAATSNSDADSASSSYSDSSSASGASSTATATIDQSDNSVINNYITSNNNVGGNNGGNIAYGVPEWQFSSVQPWFTKTPCTTGSFDLVAIFNESNQVFFVFSNTKNINAQIGNTRIEVGYGHLVMAVPPDVEVFANSLYIPSMPEEQVPYGMHQTKYGSGAINSLIPGPTVNYYGKSLIKSSITGLFEETTETIESLGLRGHEGWAQNRYIPSGAPGF